MERHLRTISKPEVTTAVRASQKIDSLPRERPVLRVSFATLEDFRREHQNNLVKGGLFIPSKEALEMRQEVEVELDLVFRGTSLRFRGEVVSVVPPTLAQAGGTPGVAVQLLESLAELRRQLEPIAGEAPEPDPGRRPGERRIAPRAACRVVGRLSSADASLAVRTRDLSHTGVLVSLEGVRTTPVGEPVQLSLVHPLTGQQLEVEGTVVRHIESKGRVPALAVAFSEREAARLEVQRFVDDLHSVGHARGLAGISGDIEAVGLASLIQSFATATPRGTLVLAQTEEEGRIVFEGGQLLGARVGSVTGVKALARMLVWKQGRFEFHADVEDADRQQTAVPLDHAMIDAARQLDEVARLSPLPVAMADRIAVAAPRLEGEVGNLSKIEEAIIELAEAGFTVRGIIDVIPEEDHVVLRALCQLLDRGVLTRAG